jgi:hypothetical protein
MGGVDSRPSSLSSLRRLVRALENPEGEREREEREVERGRAKE